MEKILLYIDNSAFRALRYDFNHSAMKTIYSGVKGKKITVYFNPILIHEIRKHLKKQITEEIKTIRLPLPILKNLSAVSVNSDFINKKKEDIVQISFEKIFENLKPKLLKFNNIDANLIADCYINHRPPFSESKKEEFPDALSIEALRPFFKKNLIVISDDKDFANFFSSHPNVTIFNSIKEFSDHFIKRTEEGNYLRKINRILQKIAQDDIEIVDEYLRDFEIIEADDGMSTIEDVDVSSIEIADINIDSIEHDTSTINASIRYAGLLSFNIITPIEAWDSVDKESIFLGSNRNKGKVEFSVMSQIKVLLKNNKYASHEIESMDHYPIEFEVPYEWGKFFNNSTEEEDHHF